MEHVDVYGGLKHYVKYSYLAEYLETRVSVEQPEAIRTDSHSGYDHSDDGGTLSLLNNTGPSRMITRTRRNMATGCEIIGKCLRSGGNGAGTSGNRNVGKSEQSRG